MLSIGNLSVCAMCKGYHLIHEVVLDGKEQVIRLRCKECGFTATDKTDFNILGMKGGN